MDSEDEQLSSQQDDSKKGGGNVLFIVLFYLLGTACYVPHSIYVTANEYWMYKFRDPDLPFNKTDTADKTTLQRNFTAYVGIAINVGMIVFIILTMRHLRKRIGVQTRIIGSMVFTLLLFAITLLFVYVDTDSWQTGFFVVALAIATLFSSSSSVLLVSVYELSTQFPPRCLAAQFAGQSVCGVLAAAIQILALLAVSSVKGTAALYYSIAAGTIAAILIFYIIVWKRSSTFQNNASDLASKIEELVKSRPEITIAQLKSVVIKLRWLLLSMILCFECTATLQPAFTSLIESSGKGTSTWSDTYFVPVCVFFLFNTFEFAARELSNYIKVVRNMYIIFTTSVLRLVLIPLIILCNIQPKNHTAVVFHDDAYFIVFIILLAITSGYLVNMYLVIYVDLCEPQEIAASRLVVLMVILVLLPIFSLLSGVFVNLI